jgi:hypothetical protein
MDFDVGMCIRNPEFKEFFRRQDLNLGEIIQIILHSYASAQQKREWLHSLLQQINEEEKMEVQNIIELIDFCLYQIYKTDENVVYVAECMDATTKLDSPANAVTTSKGSEVTFHDNMAEMTEFIDRNYAPATGDANREMYICQIIKSPNKKHYIKIEFSMTWIDGKLEIFTMYPNEEWLKQKGIKEKTILNFDDTGICYRKLPFAKGDRLRIKTPLMSDYIYGSVTSAECDACGSWYYFFTPDGEQKDDAKIILNYHEIDLTSGYAVYDWVERI